MRIGYRSVSHRAAATYTPPPPAGTWTPAQMSSVLAWWDPTQGVTLASGKVSSWVDAKNGVTASQATTTIQPPFLSTTMNGFPGLVMSQSAAYQLNAAAIASASPMSIVCITNPVAVGANPLTVTASTTTGGIDFRSTPSLHFGIVKQAVVDIATSTTVITGTYGINVATVDSTTYGFRYNGSADGSGSNTQGAMSAGTLVLFTDPFPGNATETWSGSIGDIILTSVVSSTSDLQKAEGYLAWKYSLSSLLPSGHPYKSAAP